LTAHFHADNPCDIGNQSAGDMKSAVLHRRQNDVVESRIRLSPSSASNSAVPASISLLAN
jgi:hypothetical protein